MEFSFNVYDLYVRHIFNMLPGIIYFWSQHQATLNCLADTAFRLLSLPRRLMLNTYSRFVDC